MSPAPCLHGMGLGTTDKMSLRQTLPLCVCSRECPYFREFWCIFSRRGSAYLGHEATLSELFLV